jgi:hypothetical protein
MIINNIIKYIKSPLLMTVTLLFISYMSVSILYDDKKETNDWIYIFDGETLNGWEGDPTYWRVEDGKMIGEVTEETLLEQNTFLIWRDGIVRDFELKVEYRVSDRGNSGINYRSQEVQGDPDEYIGGAPYALIGYQADIDGPNWYTGMNYEERRRTTIAERGEKVLLPSISDAYDLEKYTHRNQWTARIVQGSLGDPDSLTEHINSGWNDYYIKVKGNRMKHYVNGILMSDITDEDPINRRFDGLLGVQVHIGPPMTIEYRNFRIRHL